MKPGLTNLPSDFGSKEEYLNWVLSDPVIFIATYLGKEFDIGHPKEGQPSPLQPFHARLLRAPIIYKQPFIFYNYPTGYAKTTLMSHDDVVYWLCKNPNLMQKIIVPDLEKSGLGLGAAITTTLENNEKLNEDFGPFKPSKGSRKRWSNTAFTVERCTRSGSRDASVEIYGWEAFKPGARAHIIRIDDVANDKTTATEEQREKQIIWVEEVVEARKGATSGFFKVIIYGTPYAYGDLYHWGKKKAKEYPKRYVYLCEQAIVYEDTCKDKNCQREHPHSLWPEAESLEYLEEERARKPIAFAKTKMCVVYPREQLAFPEKAVEATKNFNRLIGHKEPHWKVFMGYDPASSTAKRTANNALLAIGVDLTEPEKRYAIDIWVGKAMLDKRIEKLLDMYVKYNCLRCNVEKNGMQGDVIQAIHKEKERLGLSHANIGKHYTGKNKFDPIDGIESLIPLVTGPMMDESNKYTPYLDIPWGDENTRKKFEPLTNALKRYPVAGEGDTYDELMALWFVELAIRKWLKARGREGYYEKKSAVARQEQIWTPIYRGGDSEEDGDEIEEPTPAELLKEALLNA